MIVIDVVIKSLLSDRILFYVYKFIGFRVIIFFSVI